jgi:hypothetical protein
MLQDGCLLGVAPLMLLDTVTIISVINIDIITVAIIIVIHIYAIPPLKCYFASLVYKYYHQHFIV